MHRNLQKHSAKFALGTTVLYKPKRPFQDQNSSTVKRAIVTRYSRYHAEGYFIEFPSGSIIKVSENDIELVKEEKRGQAD
jgi:hypothetical protein